MLPLAEKKIYIKMMPEMPDLWRWSEACGRSYSNLECSHGCLINQRDNDYSWRPDSKSDKSASPVLVNPFTGSAIVFPAAPRYFLYTTLSALPTSPDCSLLLIAHDFLDYCVMTCGINSNKWTVWRVPDHVGTSGWLGAVVLKDKVYVCHGKEGLFEGDASSSELNRLDTQNTDDILRDTFGCHLIGLDTDLFMITEKPMPAKDLIEAYRLDWPTMAWKRVMDIGDRAVFLHLGGGRESCEVYDTRRVKGARRNCVYRSVFKHDTFSIIPLSGGVEYTKVHVSLGRAFPALLGGHAPMWVSMTGLVLGYSLEA